MVVIRVSMTKQSNNTDPVDLFMVCNDIAAPYRFMREIVVENILRDFPSSNVKGSASNK